MTISPGSSGECPNPNALSDFNAGRLSDPEMEGVAAHIGTCERCEETLRSLLLSPADSFEAGLIRVCSEFTSNASMNRQIRLVSSGKLAHATTSFVLRDAVGFDLPATQTIGPYNLAGVLGRGGMGVVYRAVHGVLQRTVALKTLYPGRENRAEALTRFRIEGEAAARLEHPSIVRVFDFNESEGTSYIAMELVEGETLAKRLTRGPLTIRKAAEFMQTIASAVNYAHEQKVLHRDLKPSNVLLSQDDKPKVTDFGLAKLLEEGREKVTETDAVMGTPAYMSPEQAAGCTNEVGPRSDVYSLGAILYESLCGVPPFVAGTKYELLMLVQKGNIVPPSEHCSIIPHELDEICLKCLEHQPSDRYASAGELSHSLGQWLAGNPIPTRRPGRVRRTARVVRRRLPYILGGMLLVAGLVGATAAVLPNTGKPITVTELVTPAPEEIRTPSGKLLPFRIRSGAERVKVTADENGTITAHTNGMCLIEYTPSPAKVPCRIRADIRHFGDVESGLVGLYFGHRSVPSQLGEIQLFGQLGFNDLRGLTPAQELIIAKGNPAPPLRPRFTNPLRLRALRLASSRGLPSLSTSELTAAGPFRLCENPGTCFRDFSLVVSPGGVTGEWAGQAVLTQSARKLSDTFESQLNEYRKKPGDPLPGVVGDFDPAGRVGVVLERGSASFRGFEIVPIESAK